MKIDSLNILRAVSIVGIIIGHGCLQMNYEPFGRFCGYLFVQIFFLMSAYLLGIKYGSKPIDLPFLLKRWKRLSAVYYPFLIIVIVTLLLLGENVTLKNVVTHFTYTNYFLQDTLWGVPFGGLWYISMMMLCYVVLLFIRPGMERLFCGWYLAVFALVILGVSLLCIKVHIPCRIPIVLTTYMIVFFRAREICLCIDKLNKVSISVMWILCNVLCLGLFLYWNLNEKLLARDITVLITSCSWLLFFMKVLNGVKCGKIFEFISCISFELYLVHPPFIIGKWSLLNQGVLTENICINAFLALLVMTIGAIILNKIGNIIAKAIV